MSSVRFTVVTANAGPARIRRFVKAVTERDPDVVCAQEMGRHPNGARLMGEHGYGTLEGTGKRGQASTPTFYRHETMTLKAARYTQLLGRVWAGKGAGPSWLKPKSLTRPRLIHEPSGRIIRVSSVHMPASQQHRRRRQLAIIATRSIARLRGGGLWIVAGDWNDRGKWNHRLMRAGGWVSSDQKRGRLATHGRQAYDRIYWRPRRWAWFQKHYTFATGSDHRAKAVVWKLRVKRSRR